MKLAMKLTFDGLLRALRLRGHSLREDKAAEQTQSPFHSLPVQFALKPQGDSQ